MSLKQKIIGIAGVIVGILVAIQGSFGYYNDDINWCPYRYLSCPNRNSFLITSVEFLIVFGLIILGLGLGLLYVSRELSKEEKEISENIVDVNDVALNE